MITQYDYRALWNIFKPVYLVSDSTRYTQPEQHKPAPCSIDNEALSQRNQPEQGEQKQRGQDGGDGVTAVKQTRAKNKIYFIKHGQMSPGRR